MFSIDYIIPTDAKASKGVMMDGVIAGELGRLYSYHFALGGKRRKGDSAEGEDPKQFGLIVEGECKVRKVLDYRARKAWEDFAHAGSQTALKEHLRNEATAKKYIQNAALQPTTRPLRSPFPDEDENPLENQQQPKKWFFPHADWSQLRMWDADQGEDIVTPEDAELKPVRTLTWKLCGFRLVAGLSKPGNVGNVTIPSHLDEKSALLVWPIFQITGVGITVPLRHTSWRISPTVSDSVQGSSSSMQQPAPVEDREEAVVAMPAAKPVERREKDSE